MKKINVLSLFGGIECGKVAFAREGITVGDYFSSEVNKYAKTVTKRNWPEIHDMGSVLDVSYSDGEIRYVENGETVFSKKTKIDVLIGGSPCQDLSRAKSGGKGLDGEKSRLFWEYVRLLEETKPEYFLLENVWMSEKNENRKIMTETLGVEPVSINSSLVSGQNRERLYWVGKRNADGTYSTVKIEQPEDKGIDLRDVLEDIPGDSPLWKPVPEKFIPKVKEFIRKKSHCIPATYAKIGPACHFKGTRTAIFGVFGLPRGGNVGGIRYDGKKCQTINASSFENNNFLVGENGILMWRKLTPLECERLQTLPDGYTEGISPTQRYKTIGNGWTVDVIAHIIRQMELA